MYAASFRTRWPIKNIEYTRAPISVTGSRSGARIATNIRRAPGVRVPVTIASHSCSCTRISVTRKAPDPDHRHPKTMPSLRVDRSADDRQERLLEGHGAHGRGQPGPEGEVHDLMDLLGPHDHMEDATLLGRPAERFEQVPMTASVLDGDPQGPADPPFRLLRRP